MIENTEQEINRFSYNIKTQDGITIFELIGELDMYTLPRAQEIIDMLIEQELQHHFILEIAYQLTKQIIMALL